MWQSFSNLLHAAILSILFKSCLLREYNFIHSSDINTTTSNSGLVRATSFLVVKEAALISVEGQMVSLARAKTPFPARATEPSKRAAIIDVPSLAPPLLASSRSFRRIKVKVRVLKNGPRFFRGAGRASFLQTRLLEQSRSMKNEKKKFKKKRNLATRAAARARERVSKNAV